MTAGQPASICRAVRGLRRDKTNPLQMDKTIKKPALRKIGGFLFETGGRPARITMDRREPRRDRAVPRGDWEGPVGPAQRLLFSMGRVQGHRTALQAIRVGSVTPTVHQWDAQDRRSGLWISSAGEPRRSHQFHATVVHQRECRIANAGNRGQHPAVAPIPWEVRKPPHARESGSRN